MRNQASATLIDATAWAGGGGWRDARANSRRTNAAGWGDSSKRRNSGRKHDDFPSVLGVGGGDANLSKLGGNESESRAIRCSSRTFPYSASLPTDVSLIPFQLPSDKPPESERLISRFGLVGGPLWDSPIVFPDGDEDCIKGTPRPSHEQGGFVVCGLERLRLHPPQHSWCSHFVTFGLIIYFAMGGTHSYLLSHPRRFYHMCAVCPQFGTPQKPQRIDALTHASF